jgi:aspartyl aminopeptidase
MTHSTLSGLLGSCASAEALAGDPHTRVMAAFNHEEVGSDSAPGAGSTMLGEVLARLSGPSAGLTAAAARKSFFVSADMAHALHPNYPGTHSEGHAPALGGGLVIKNNVSQRYATDAPGAYVVRAVGAAAGVPIQDFCARQDSGCGSTIGPIVATRLGVRTVDVGLPQLSMHSAREMMGAADVAHGVRFFEAYYSALPGLAVQGSD